MKEKLKAILASVFELFKAKNKTSTSTITIIANRNNSNVNVYTKK